MNLSFPRCLLLAAIASCSLPALADSQPPAFKLNPWNTRSPLVAEDVQFVAASLSGGADLRIAASGQRGLLLLDEHANELARLPGQFSALDSRAAGQQLLVASLDASSQQPTLAALDVAARQWQPGLQLPAREFSVEGLCLYRDNSSNLFLFLVGAEGRGEQWLVGQGAQLSSQPRLVRSLPLPPQAGFCQVEDRSGQLFVNEENVGLWVYPAAAEASASRQPVALRQPFGRIGGGAGAMAVVPGGLLALDPEARALHLLAQQDGEWVNTAILPLGWLQEPERLAVQQQGDHLRLLIQDDGSGRFQQGELQWQPQAAALEAVLPVVTAARQSDPVARQGDAADDPAIWVNPHQPQQSRVLGTNKKQGLLAYDLDGHLLQELAVGRLNNVDVRHGFQLGSQQVDLAVASNRDTNSISLFSIDRSSGELQPAGEIATPLAEIYGICLFQPASGELYAFANGKDGSFLQYRLDGGSGRISGKLVRRFAVASQPEGCVVDDQRQRLFLGEEDAGLWAVDARAEGDSQLQSVLAVGEVLKADVEGVALYRGTQHDYLVVSSQGNDSYVVLDAEPPYALRGAFRVGLDGELGIDGASETDGLEVTSASLGGPWGSGLLVVQDGRKRMPQSSQNFKFVAWDKVAQALQLD